MLHHTDSTKKKIIGRALKSYKWLTEDEFQLKFTDGGSVKVSVQGDCCSTSVFYTAFFPPEVIGAEIIDVEETDAKQHDPDNPCEDSAEVAKAVSQAGWSLNDYSTFRIWDIVFKTKKGDFLLRHINESNGYYDGMTNYIFED